MSFVYTEAKRMLLAGELDLDAHDIRMLLVLNTTTADTEEDIANLAAFSSLAEVSDGSYARKALTSEAVAADNTNNRGEFSSDTPVQWTSLTTSGTVQAVILYKHVGADNVNKPIAFIDTGGFPFSLSGGTLNINQNAEGWLQAA